MIKCVVSLEFNLGVASNSPAVNTHRPTDCCNIKKLYTATAVFTCLIRLSQHSYLPIILLSDIP